MHSVNLDLLRTASRQADPHAHHRAAHLADLRAARRQRWQGHVARLRALFADRSAAAAKACVEQAR